MPPVDAENKGNELDKALAGLEANPRQVKPDCVFCCVTILMRVDKMLARMDRLYTKISAREQKAVDRAAGKERARERKRKEREDSKYQLGVKVRGEAERGIDFTKLHEETKQGDDNA